MQEQQQKNNRTNDKKKESRSKSFTHEWKHLKQVKLPNINERYSELV